MTQSIPSVAGRAAAAHKAKAGSVVVLDAKAPMTAFLAAQEAADAGTDITEYGGWRAYRAR